MNHQYRYSVVPIQVFICLLIAFSVQAEVAGEYVRLPSHIQYNNYAQDQDEAKNEAHPSPQAEPKPPPCIEIGPKPDLTITFLISVDAACVLLVAIGVTVCVLEYVFNARTFRINLPPARHPNSSNRTISLAGERLLSYLLISTLSLSFLPTIKPSVYLVHTLCANYKTIHVMTNTS